MIEHEARLKIGDMDLSNRTFGDGPPLFLLHGFFGTGQMWEAFLPGLAAEFQLIVPDLRGHGKSTNPSQAFTHRQSALDMFALADALGIDRFRAMGYSTGSMTLLHGNGATGSTGGDHPILPDQLLPGASPQDSDGLLDA